MNAYHPNDCLKTSIRFRSDIKELFKSDLSTKNESVSVYLESSDDDTLADAAARSLAVSGCKAGCERPEL